MSQLSKKAMLVKLSISQWSTNKFDKKVTEAIHQSHKAGNDAGRYTKRLVAKSTVETIKKTANEARTFHYEQTLPWKDDGYRMLPSANYMDYTKEIRKLKSRFTRAVHDFVAQYPMAVTEAKKILNGMFDAADYPVPSDIQDKYDFVNEVLPLPDESDFRVSLQANEMSRIRRDMKRTIEQAQKSAMDDLWNRLYKVVEHANERLKDPKAVFRDSLIDNARELVKLLPRLNVTNDKDLADMAKEVQKNIGQYQPDELRKSKKLRKKVAKSAEGMLDDMANKMAGYTGGDK